MKINMRILNGSLWLALFTILIFPGKFISKGPVGIAYGYPYPFFILYSNDQWLIKGVGIQLIYFAIDAVFMYCVILGVKIIYKLISKKLNSNSLGQ